MSNRNLGSLVDIINGFAFDSAFFSDDNSKMPLMRIRDVVRGYTDTYTSEPYDEKYVIKMGEIVIGMDGNFNISRWQSTDALLNQRVCKLSVSSTSLDSQYLLYYLQIALKKIEDETSFVTVKHLSSKKISDLSIFLPHIEEQRLISATLDAVSKLIQLRKKQLEELDRLVNSQFSELFGNTDQSMYKSMSEICSIITDGTHQPPKFADEGVPFLFVSNITGNVLTYDAEKFISEETYHSLIRRTPIEINDLLLSTVGSYGHPAIVMSDKKFCFQRHIAYLKPRHELVNSYFLHAAILSNYGQQQIERKVKGVAQKTLNLSEIKTIRIPLPKLADQNQFAVFVKKIDISKSAIQKSIGEQEVLKQKLMQQFHEV